MAKQTIVVAWIVIGVACSTWPAAYAGKRESEKELVHFERSLAHRDGAVPPCTPLIIVKERRDGVKKAESTNGAWELFIAPSVWNGFAHHPTLAECVLSAGAYDGRFTEAHIEALAEQRLSTGMPYEFVLMILGPPTARIASTMTIDEITGDQVTRDEYLWQEPHKGSGFRRAMVFLSAAAVGIGGLSSDLDTMIDASRVAAVASSAEIISWELTSFETAERVIVIVQDGMVHTVRVEAVMP